MISYNDLYHAYKQCRLGKKPSNAQVSFEMKLGQNLSALEKEIQSRTYKPSPYRTFIVTRPKPREIFAANFRDRVLHHLMVSRLSPIWEKKFYYGSFACRTGRGTHGALRYFKNLYNKVSEGERKEVWVLQLDIASFFVTIQRPILKQLLLETIQDDELAWLISTTLDNDPRLNAFIGSSKERRKIVSYEKSLFSKLPTEGLPIGNLTSQFGANVYLNALDHYVSRFHRPKGYMRYMDDLTLLDTDKSKLEKMIGPIDKWLQEKRGQKLHPKKTTLKSLQKESIELLGYRFLAPEGRLVMQTRYSKQWELVALLRKQEKRGLTLPRYNHPLSIEPSHKEMKKFINKVNCRVGMMKHASSYSFRKSALEKFQTTINQELNFLCESPIAAKNNFTKIKQHKIKFQKKR